MIHLVGIEILNFMNLFVWDYDRAAQSLSFCSDLKVIYKPYNHRQHNSLICIREFVYAACPTGMTYFNRLHHVCICTKSTGGGWLVAR
jgi:hypothetical protein